MAQMRLDRLLGEMGVGTRTQIKELAKKGRVSVNGQVEKKTDRKVDPAVDKILVDGRQVAYTRWSYYLLNKPQGVVSARTDDRYPTVTGLIRDADRKDLFPVGRLDIDTEGLLLLTNDGDLAHQLLSPRKHVDKVYFVTIEGRLPEDHQKQLAAGLTLEDGTRTLPAELSIQREGADGMTDVLLTIHEGKFHQVKRMFEALGCRVVYLKRISMGPLALDEGLAPGQYRPLTPAEIGMLKAAGTAKGPSGAVFAGKEERTEEGAKRPDLRRERG